ncbi:MAG: MurR/RpiR family transcriptional regulator [Deltaproteobacteria bacterium]|jgi:DNA-binding MurR/RpiR family transcriptional regulator|nr:MurR/RpiR family transcriptional regulator [Deltaproteobacteria bacterium]
MSDNIIEVLKDLYETLTPTLQRLASYIIDNHKEAAFLNAMTLAKSAGVSEASITRLTYALKMKGFSELRQSLQEYARNMISLPKYDYKNVNGFILNEVANMEKSIIDEMVETISEDDFNRAVDTLYKAKSINVVATHYNYVSGLYASYFMRSIRPQINLISALDISIFTSSLSSSPSDVVLAVSTARYPTDTQKIVKIFKSQGLKIISVTDSKVSPLIPLSDIALIVPMKFISYIDPLSGIMVLLHSLINALYIQNASHSKQMLIKYDEFIKDNDINLDNSKSITDI